MMLSQAMNAYISHKLASNSRAATLKLYSSTLTDFAGFCRHHNYTASQITGPVIQAYLIARRDRGYADTTVQGDHRIITAFTRWMESHDYCPPINYRRDCPAPRVDVRSPRCLTREEYTRLVAAARSSVRRYACERARDIALVLFLVDTGLRKSEALRLNVGDLDYTRRKLRVSASAKSRRERWVYYGDHCTRALRAYLQARGYVWVDGKPVGDLAEPLWLTRQGTRLEATRAWAIVKQIAAVAGLEGVCVHTLRHSACTLLLEANMPITEVREILGHTKIATTLHYTHLTDEVIGEHYRGACPGDW